MSDEPKTEAEILRRYTQARARIGRAPVAPPNLMSLRPERRWTPRKLMNVAIATCQIDDRLFYGPSSKGLHARRLAIALIREMLPARQYPMSLIAPLFIRTREAMQKLLADARGSPAVMREAQAVAAKLRLRRRSPKRRTPPSRP